MFIFQVKGISNLATFDFTLATNFRRKLDPLFPSQVVNLNFFSSFILIGVIFFPSFFRHSVDQMNNSEGRILHSRQSHGDQQRKVEMFYHTDFKTLTNKFNMFSRHRIL